MTIEKICVYSFSHPEPRSDLALIRLANPSEGQPAVEFITGSKGFHSETIIRAAFGADIVAVMGDRLTALDFESNNDLTLAISSGCWAFTACDAAYIAHIAMPNVPVETPDGGQIKGFRTHISPIIDSEFDHGVIAAFDNIDVSSNPHSLGTADYDRWMSGHQSAQLEGASVAASA